MELLSQVSNVQFLYPAAAVAVVLVCAALVFIFGFHSAEQPQFDKLPLVLDDRKSSNKKRKIKEKKSSPNRTADEVKTKTDSSKKSPAKEKKEEKTKEPEKPKPKDKVTDSKPAKKETSGEVKKGKKKLLAEVEKPADFDEGVWEEVPKKSDKKKVKAPEEKDKKDSPVKKNKKKAKDADVEAARSTEEPAEDQVKAVNSVDTLVDEETNRALQAQVEEFQRVLKEAELREQAAFGSTEEEETAEDDLAEVKDLRSIKKKENKEKQIKKKVESAVAKNASKSEEKDNSDLSDKQDNNENALAFDELGDTWTDTKVSKKSKKKARKDQ